MTDNNHPITPSEDLIQQLREDCPYHVSAEIAEWLATQAYRAGADQELEACCEWLEYADEKEKLCRARRPKPPSLAEEALVAWKTEDDAWPVKSQEKGKRFAIVRRALEQLQELEGQAND